MAIKLNNIDTKLRSDLAFEFLKPKNHVIDEDISIDKINLTKRRAMKINKVPGIYMTVSTDIIIKDEYDKIEKIVVAISCELRKLIKGRKILVVGLGNRDLISDRLGCDVCSKIKVSRLMSDSFYEISCICPGVLGNTGIESFEVIKGAVEQVKPSTLIVIDSLCAGSLSRLFTTFQITNAGIRPGSGVSNNKNMINKESMGCEVVCIGVPTVVYASTIYPDIDDKYKDLIVTPKDIDVQTLVCSNIISKSINEAFE